MFRNRGLFAMLGALTAAGVAVSANPAAGQAAPYYGLVAQLGVSCLVPTAAGGYVTAATPAEVSVCCAILLAVGPENIDFLEAVAIGDRSDPRLIVLDGQLVDVLLTCREQAIQRLAELAMAGPAPAPGAIR
ncbi:MAG: hypothetical protein IT534_14165 [Bauldia sp.]|jgi:hypothetical protein|nr:hypothetical protein [Bauldia sp.]